MADTGRQHSDMVRSYKHVLLVQLFTKRQKEVNLKARKQNRLFFFMDVSGRDEETIKQLSNSTL